MATSLDQKLLENVNVFGSWESDHLEFLARFHDTLEEHEQHVLSVLAKSKEANLRLKLKKCEFHVQETESRP